jgi:lipopolysaccharide export system permease protein
MLDIIFSSDTREIAEWQWRLSQPISVLILSIFAILLGKTSPRGGKNLGVLAGIIVFIIYNNALLIAKSSLERGDTLPIIGLWWVHLLVLLIIFVFYAYRHGKLSQLIKKPF